MKFLKASSEASDNQKRLRKILTKARSLRDDLDDTPSGFIENHDLGMLYEELLDSIQDLSYRLGER